MSKKLPFIKSDIPRDLRMYLDRLRELVSGAGSDRLVSLDELVGAGIAGTNNINDVTAPKVTALGTPPSPTNVVAAGAVQTIIITWDDPKYFGHAYAEVWASDTSTIGSAVLIGQSPGAIYTDPTGPSAARYYWVRFVNTNDAAGPYNAVGGVLGESAPEVEHLLDVLAGEITETQLFADLGARIDLVDGTGPGSVDARILTSTDGLNAQYTVKIDANDYVTGFGLASTLNNATPYSTFAVRADKFYIASPEGPGVAPALPFVVNTTEQTVNGVVVPVGVYMDGAYVKNGTIVNAKIADAAIDNAKISDLSVGKLKAGSIATGEYIQSTNYVAGTSGWRINGGGAAEFGAAAIRGKVLATQIDAKGLSILDAEGHVVLSAGASVAASTFSGNVDGEIDGTAASTVKTNASSALANASTAQDAADAAQLAADAAQLAADNAQTAADAAQLAAEAAALSASAKLARSGAQILVGPVTLNAASAITVGTPALDEVSGKNGFYIGSTGIVGTKNGSATFTLDNDGNALFKGNLTGATGTFSGSVAVGTIPAVSGETMTGTGARLNADGTFAMGTVDTNISFNGTKMSLNGNVVGNRNLLPGASVPDVVLAYTGNVNTALQSEKWTRIPFDSTALKNQVSSVPHGGYFSLPAGTYYYELSVGCIFNGGSDGSEGTFTALAVNKTDPLYTYGDDPSGIQDLVGYDYEGNPIYQTRQITLSQPTILSYAGASKSGDWQFLTVYGVNRFTLTVTTDIMVVGYFTGSPSMTIQPFSGYTSRVLKIWRDN